MAGSPRYLVTGGAGFIGSNIVDALVNRGERVRVLDNFSTGKRGNLAGYGDRVEVVEGDIRDIEACRTAARGVEVIFHQAALASVPRSLKDPITVHDVNVNGSITVLVAAKACGVRRVVYASSSSVYGAREGLPRTEDDAPAPLSPYAASKLAVEFYLYVYFASEGLETVALRYFNVFGPRQDPNSQYAAVVPSFLRQLLDGNAPTIYGDGEQTRDFTYIENVVHGNLLAAEAPAAAGRTMNLACGDRFSVNYLFERLADLTGSSLTPRYEPGRPGDVPHSQADIARARELLEYRPRVSFEDGLARTVAWFRDQRND